jgi:hypothetical protein
MYSPTILCQMGALAYSFIYLYFGSCEEKYINSISTYVKHVASFHYHNYLFTVLLKCCHKDAVCRYIRVYI